MSPTNDEPQQPSTKGTAVVDILEWKDNPVGAVESRNGVKYMYHGPTATKREIHTENGVPIENTVENTRKREETIKQLNGAIGVGNYKMNGSLKKGLLR